MASNSRPVQAGVASYDQQPGHVDMRSFIAASTARGQIIDLDPDLTPG